MIRPTEDLLDEVTTAYVAMRAAVRRYRHADTELRRAENSDDPERLNRAGTRYAIAKINLVKHLK